MIRAAILVGALLLGAPAALAQLDDGRYFAAVMAGRFLAAADAEKLEESLKTDPGDLMTRAQLLGYYSARTSDIERVKTLRLTHALWLVEHHPESVLASPQFCGIQPEGSPLASPGDYQRLREKWLAETRKTPPDARVLTNAAQWMRLSDVPLAVDLLKRAREADSLDFHPSQILGEIFGQAILGSYPALARSAIETLDTSTDIDLLSTAAIMIAPQDSAAALKPENIEMAERWLAKAQSLDPRNPEWAQRLRKLMNRSGKPLPAGTIFAPPAEGLRRFRVEPADQAEKLTHQVAPDDSPARDAGVSGTVVFDALIDPAGRVADLQLLSGHRLLVALAEKAVLQWIYLPTLVRGQPVEVVTRIEVTFPKDPK